MHLLIKLMADGAVVPVILIGAWALVFKIKGNRYHAYCRILLAGLTAYTAAQLIGSIYQPEFERPFQMMGTSAGASFLNNAGFPSDHVLFCAAIVLAVWFETRQKKLAIALAALTALVAIGRVLALVHTPLDVLGGAVIALSGAFWYLQRDHPPKPGIIKQWSKPRKIGKIS
jgi:membrane-associated phospholipid phosphatase